jgi:hypothetical protein
MECRVAGSGVGELGVDGVGGDRPAAVVADQVDLDRLAAGVPAGDCRGVHRPFVAPLLEGECARLLPLGATRVRLLVADGVNESCLVMQDVEGNEFCLD